MLAAVCLNWLAILLKFKAKPTPFPQYHRSLDIMSKIGLMCSVGGHICFPKQLCLKTHAVCLIDQRASDAVSSWAWGLHVCLSVSHKVHPVVAINGFKAFYTLEPFLDIWLFHSLRCHTVHDPSGYPVKACSCHVNSLFFSLHHILTGHLECLTIKWLKFPSSLLIWGDYSVFLVNIFNFDFLKSFLTLNRKSCYSFSESKAI